jgi:DNA repair exonuclease SbcCD nuclease subunit
MSKIIFIPDVHLQEYSPRSRKDNYPGVVLEKLSWVADYANMNDATCIFLGDIFNAVNMPMIYMYRCIEVFKKFNKVPYAIIGNHDVPRNNQELMDRSPLGLLEKVGLVQYLEHLEMEGSVVVEGFHYTQPIAPTKQLTDTVKPMKKICVAHVFYENPFFEDHNLKVADCVTLGYDYYVLGHDHTRYDLVDEPKYKVFRIGSLTRGTANENQLTRDNVYILEYDIGSDKFTEVPVPCEKARDVFKESIFQRKEENVINTEEILNNLVFTSNDSIYDVLDNAEQTPEIKAIVEEYLQAAGIYRESL